MRSILSRAALLAALALALAGRAHAQAAPATPPPADTAADWRKAVIDEVREAHVRWTRVFANGTESRIAAMFAPDAVVYSDAGGVQVEQFASLTVASGRQSAEFKTVGTEAVSNDEMRELGTYRFYGHGELFRGDYTMRWVRGADHRWRIQELRMIASPGNG